MYNEVAVLVTDTSTIPRSQLTMNVDPMLDSSHFSHIRPTLSLITCLIMCILARFVRADLTIFLK